MRCPRAATALALAALAALPCHGTEADATFTLLNADRRRASPSTLSRTYRRLHTPYFDLASYSLQASKNASRCIYNSNSAPGERTANKISRRDYSSPGLQKLGEQSPCMITVNNAGAETAAQRGGSDFSKATPERNHKRRKRLAQESGHSVVALGSSVASPTAVERPAVREALPTTGGLKEQSTVAPIGTVRPSVARARQQPRRKPGDVASSAPLLNYIFDTYSSTHQHRNDRAGGGGRMTAAAPAVEALVGSTAQLDCKVDALHDKLVSWVRRKGDGEGMELLTTGTQKYTADDRYSARFLAPDTWRLEIADVRAADAAFYDCQLPAHPPRTARVALHVPAVSVAIVDGAGAPLSEQVCELGSTVTLRCEVRGLRMEGRALHWYRRDTLLNDDTTRGGISVRTELGAEGADSVLRVARVGAADAGPYACAVQAAPPVRVALHVIQGESLAELHAGGGCGGGGGGGGGALLALLYTIYFHLYYN